MSALDMHESYEAIVLKQNPRLRGEESSSIARLGRAFFASRKGNCRNKLSCYLVHKTYIFSLSSSFIWIRRG
jgi:hypothetical protein